jgi:hypothetical protein
MHSLASFADLEHIVFASKKKKGRAIHSLYSALEIL